MRILIVPAGEIEALNKLSKKDTLIRCQQALRLWKSNKFDYLLLSGGLFSRKNTQTKPAAKIMQNWFIKRGLEPKRILIEAKSLDTFENIKFSLQLINDLDISSEIFVVSQRLHVLRFYITFRFGYGIKIKAYRLNYKLTILQTIKELLYICYHFYDPMGVKYLARYNRRRRQRKNNLC